MPHVEESKMGFKGRLKIYKNGRLVREVDNLVVDGGLELLAGRICGATPSLVDEMAMGTANATPAATDTALGAEVGRVSLSTAGGTLSGTVITYEASFPAGTATGAITEAGLFDATAGVMLCRTTFGVITKAASDVVSILWTLETQRV